MPRIATHGNTPYYRESEHTEVVGVVDRQGTLWLKDIPNGEALKSVTSALSSSLRRSPACYP